jgi:threonine dehydrogenase-like Zn-dependent dehydrogenase
MGKMSNTGRVAVLYGEHQDYVIEELEVPQPGPGEVLIRVKLCGICGTDVHDWVGGPAAAWVQYPVVYGHEIVGTIEALGEGFDTDCLGRKVEVGDQVVPGIAYPCGSCYFCTVVREPSKCVNSQAYSAILGVRGFTAGFGEYLYMNIPGSTVFKVNAPPEVAVLLEPASIAVKAVDRAHMLVGSTAVIQGAGAIGLMTMLFAKEAGATKTIVVDSRPKRLALARELGADYGVDMNEFHTAAERVKRVKELTPGGYGADTVFECAGVPAALPEGMDYLRPGGTYVEMGHFLDNGTVEINPCTHLCSKSITLVTVWAGELTNFVRAIPVLESGKYAFEKLLTHQIPLDRINEVFKALEAGEPIDGRETMKVALAL